MKRALQLRAQGMTSPAIARLIGITAKAQKERFVRHDWRTNGADRPASRQQAFRDQAIALLEDGKTLRGIAAELRVSASLVQRIKSKAPGLASKPKAPRVSKKQAAPEKPAVDPIWTKARQIAADPICTKERQIAADPICTKERQIAADPIWTKERQIAAERLLKKRWCIDHIASDLCQLPGPPVLPRDVVVFRRAQRAA